MVSFMTRPVKPPHIRSLWTSAVMWMLGTPMKFFTAAVAPMASWLLSTGTLISLRCVLS